MKRVRLFWFSASSCCCTTSMSPGFGALMAELCEQVDDRDISGGPDA